MTYMRFVIYLNVCVVGLKKVVRGLKNCKKRLEKNVRWTPHLLSTGLVSFHICFQFFLISKLNVGGKI